MAKVKPRKEYRRNCENCDKPYIARREHGRFCSPACRVESWKKHNWVKKETYKKLESRIAELEKLVKNE